MMPPVTPADISLVVDRSDPGVASWADPASFTTVHGVTFDAEWFRDGQLYARW